MKTKKILMCIVAVLSITILASLNIYKESNLIFGILPISQKEADEIKKSRNYLDEDVSIFMNEIKIPNIKYGEYLLPQNSDSVYNGLLNTNGYNIKVIKNEYDKKSLLEGNIPLEILVFNDDYYRTDKIYLTNMPIIEFIENSYDKETDEHTGVFRLLEINHKGRNGILYELNSDVKYHVRGGTSVLFDKKSYKFNLKDKNGNSRKENLLDMRYDDDWILNAMFIDDTKAREQVAYDVWNKMNGIIDDNVKYVEFIKNGWYEGIYNLQVPYDYKYFGMTKENDVLVKIKLTNKNLTEPRILFEDEVFYTKNQFVDEFNISQFDEINYNATIKLLRKVVYDAFKDNLKNLDYKEEIKLSYDLESYADYNLFINMIGSNDNSYKNQILRFTQNSDGYILYKHPWDLDYSMGEDFFGNIPTGERFNDYVLPDEIKNNPQYFKLQKNKYHELRKSFFNVEYLNSLLDTHLNELNSGGAMIREVKQWGEEWGPYLKKDINTVRNSFSERIAFLDDYYEYEE